MSVKIFISDTTNPWFNLATEDWIFQDMEDVDHVLFLWRNADAVVIGRSQNPWLECNLDKMKVDSVKLARRQSGGGAVFHDLGNTNFTFLSKREHYERSENFDIITKALNTFGIIVTASGRNDLIVDMGNGETRKISGSAFKEKKDRAFHHGTLLLDANLDKLQSYLNPNPKKLEAKGIKSVRSRVTNLKALHRGIHHEAVCQAIIETFQEHHDVIAAPEMLSTDALKTIAKLSDHYDRLGSWDWLYGQTMEFTHEFERYFNWGLVHIQLQVKDARIVDARVYSDSLYPDMIDAIAQKLRGNPYDAEVIAGAFLMVKQLYPSLYGYIDEVQSWVVSEI